MRKLLLMVVLLIGSTSIWAETFVYIVPSGVDGGNAKWAQQFVAQWNKKLQSQGHDMVLRYIPGKKGKKGFLEWHKKYKDKDTVVVQSNGFINYLTTNGWNDFSPLDIATIGGQIQGTFVFKKTDITPGTDDAIMHIDGGAEVILDAMAVKMLACGPSLECTVPIRFVKGFKDSGERRKAFIDGMINISRDGFSHKNKTYKQEIKDGITEIWFSQGIVDTETNKIIPDPNHTESWFIDAYVAKWGEKPKGLYFEGYKQVLKMRSALGKTVFTKKDNIHYDLLVSTFNEVLADEDAMKKLTKKLGNYPWHTGETSQKLVDKIWKFCCTIDGYDEHLYQKLVNFRREFGENTEMNEAILR